MIPIVTISMPCYGRPQRTMRAMECLLSQTATGFEAIIIGDHCPDFQQLLISDWYRAWKYEMDRRGNQSICFNKYQKHGGYGYHCTNMAIGMASGEYFMFMANDDVILPQHITAYYKQAISDRTYDFVYMPSKVEALGYVRKPELEFGKIGHSELIIKSSFLKKMPQHTSQYGHDWTLVENMLKAGAKHRAAVNDPSPTYIVKSTPNKAENDID